MRTLKFSVLLVGIVVDLGIIVILGIKPELMIPVPGMLLVLYLFAWKIPRTAQQFEAKARRLKTSIAEIPGSWELLVWAALGLVLAFLLGEVLTAS